MTDVCSHKTVAERVADRLTNELLWFRCSYKCGCGFEWPKIKLTPHEQDRCLRCRTLRDPHEIWEI